MNAGHKWLHLFLDVLEKEISDGPLLTEGAHKLVERSPILGRAVIISGGVIITLHLAKILNEDHDLMARNFWKRII